MNVIHQMVIRFNGAYTHDDVFHLEAREVKYWQLQQYEEDMLARRLEMIQREEQERRQ